MTSKTYLGEMHITGHASDSIKSSDGKKYQAKRAMTHFESTSSSTQKTLRKNTRSKTDS